MLLARLATLVKARRLAAGAQPLLLDGDDFSMDTLFHTVSREIGGERRLMSALDYDGATLGNPAFDFRPVGLAAMSGAAVYVARAESFSCLVIPLCWQYAIRENLALQAGLQLIIWLLRRRWQRSDGQLEPA